MAQPCLSSLHVQMKQVEPIRHKLCWHLLDFGRHALQSGINACCLGHSAYANLLQQPEDVTWPPMKTP